MTQPLVSVIIPSYNYARFLPQALQSVLTQSYPHTEIIVVDDGSTDDTSKILVNYGERIKVLRKPNGGLPAARNSGVEISTGDYLAFIDADDLWLPQKLEKQIALFQQNADVALVHCGVQDVDQNGKPLSDHLDGMSGQVADEMLFFRRAVILGGGSAAMVTRRAYDEVGGFDVGLTGHSEDWDFYFRVARRHAVGFVPEILVQYRLHSSNMHHNIATMDRMMLRAYAKTFADPDPHLQRLRRRAYGQLHMMLAGSYFRNGQPYHFARHALKSLWFTPDNLTRVLGFPVRWWDRHRFAGKITATTKL